jgi:hypothetical protein
MSMRVKGSSTQPAAQREKLTVNNKSSLDVGVLKGAIHLWIWNDLPKNALKAMETSGAPDDIFWNEPKGLAKLLPSAPRPEGFITPAEVKLFPSFLQPGLAEALKRAEKETGIAKVPGFTTIEQLSSDFTKRVDQANTNRKWLLSDEHKTLNPKEHEALRKSLPVEMQKAWGAILRNYEKIHPKNNHF